jgi:hypothetical protein
VALRLAESLLEKQGFDAGRQPVGFITKGGYDPGVTGRTDSAPKPRKKGAMTGKNAQMSLCETL